jgi:hypothetical protein
LDLGLRAIVWVDEIEQLHEKHRLRLEASLVIVVSHNEEDILEDCNEEALEKGVRSGDVRLLGNVVNQLQAHVQASRLNIAVVVLESPRAGVNHKLELVVVKLEKS